MYRSCGKIAIDVVAAVCILTLLTPLLGVVGLLVRIKLGSPVLFRQQRAGKHGVAFELLKFRTMTAAVDEYGVLLPDDKRLTDFGRLLRKSSLDELPQLWNVITGKMSLIGPRPLLLRYVDRYSSAQARRLEVRPGITGWAQVIGRNAISWERRFELDVEYVDNMSLWMDLKIAVMTVFRVLRQRNVSADEHATMPEFMGSATVGSGIAVKPE